MINSEALDFHSSAAEFVICDSLVVLRFPLFLSLLLAFAPALAFGQDEDIDERLAAATERLAAELATKADLELPPLPEELAKQKPPEIIRRAGDDYVKAWRTYRIVTLQRPGPQKPPAPQKPVISVNTTDEGAANFKDLLLRAIEAKDCPEPEEFEGFTYTGDGECATPIFAFWATRSSGKALAMLRRGEYFPALQIFAELHYSPALESLLRAYQVDPDEFIVGAWLNRRLTQYDFPPSSGDKAAAMLLKWVELRWQAEGKDSATGCRRNSDEPFYPLEGFLGFLEVDSHVADDTKRKMARFLENQGCEIYSQEYWMERVHRGREKWLMPLVKRSLGAKTNWARIRASKILTEAGIPHPTPVLRKDPRFRVTVNGKPWPGVLDPGHAPSAPSISIHYKGGSRIFGLAQGEDGIFSADADSFLGSPETKKIGICNSPGSTGADPTPPSAAWLQAEIPLPTRFGEVTDVDVKVFELSIEPKLPQSRETPVRPVEIDFGRVDDVYPQPRGNCYNLQGATRLTLPYVSPGNYWLRVRHPGAALMPWQKVKVSKNGEVISPELKAGSTLVVPVAWPEDATGKPQLPAEAALLLKKLGRNGYMQFLELRKDGKRLADIAPVPAIKTSQFQGCAIFPNLAPGDYEIISNWNSDRNKEATTPKPSVKATIRANDAVYLMSDPLLMPSGG